MRDVFNFHADDEISDFIRIIEGSDYSVIVIDTDGGLDADGLADFPFELLVTGGLIAFITLLVGLLDLDSGVYIDMAIALEGHTGLDLDNMIADGSILINLPVPDPPFITTPDVLGDIGIVM